MRPRNGGVTATDTSPGYRRSRARARNGDIPKACPLRSTPPGASSNGVRARTPAGHYAVHAFYPWVTSAGTGLHCARCGVSARAPLPKAADYGAVVEGFVAEHKHCTEAA